MSDKECSFCGKRSKEVRWLIAGPTAHICDECVDLCVGIIRDEKAGLDAVGRRQALDVLQEALGELGDIAPPEKEAVLPSYDR